MNKTSSAAMQDRQTNAILQDRPATQYSIYPSQGVRVGLHILYWLVAYWYQLVVTAPSFHAEIFSPLPMLFCLFPLSAAICVHYYFCACALPHLHARKWALLAMDILLMYLVTWIAYMYLGTRVTTLVFPADTRASLVYERLWVHPFYSYTSLHGLILGVVNAIWLNGPAAMLKIGIDHYESLRQKNIIQAQKQAMEISFLRAQIQPHFLFNSLNSIYGLVLENEAASASVLQLSDLLRFSLYDSSREYVSLREEIQFLENYLLLEKQRHPAGEVQIRYDFLQVLDPAQVIRPLLLINFVEHAFKYGVNTRIKGAWAEMTLQERGGLLRFEVRHNHAPPGTSIPAQSLQNVQRRLALEYPDRHRLDILETPAAYAVVLELQLQAAAAHG